MSIAVEGHGSRDSPTFLTQGFRPFFLAAGLWSAAALALWIVMFATGTAVPSRFDPLTWHIHEMLFGFVMATVAGFLLTAIPNWTQRLPVSGLPLAALAGLWLLGRISCLGLGPHPYLARNCRGPLIPSPPRCSRRSRNHCRQELAQSANNSPDSRTWRCQSPDASGSRRYCLVPGIGMASWALRRDRADLCGGRAYRAELHRELAGKAP